MTGRIGVVWAPKLQALHTIVMKHFQDVDKTDIDACILVLEDETVRHKFEIDFKLFAKQMDIIMPDAAAQEYLADLKFLGKVNLGARNLYRDAQLDLTGVGAKVRALIDEHVRATGVDPKIPPIDLLATDFKKRVQEHKSDRAKASEIEYAIKDHINVKLDDDPEYYASLSEKLSGIIEKHKEHWDELVQMLMNFRDDIEQNRGKEAEELGLDDTEFAFHNILMAEIARVRDDEAIDQSTHDEVIAITKELVRMLDVATGIVDFFNKPDEVAEMKRLIKRTLTASSFDNPDIRNAVMDRFMELAKVRFRG